jgi:peptidoglycan/LPS O-acetylase OafA/YrhL
MTLAYGVAIMLVSTGLAILSWKLLEEPFNRMKERFAPRRVE